MTYGWREILRVGLVMQNHHVPEEPHIKEAAQPQGRSPELNAKRAKFV
jgi:hypothetical protein